MQRERDGRKIKQQEIEGDGPRVLKARTPLLSAVMPFTIIRQMEMERGGGGKKKAEAEVVAQVTLNDNYEHKKSSSEIIMSIKSYLRR